MDIALALNDYKYTGAVADNKKDSFDSIVWLDARPKPTWNQLKTIYKDNYFTTLKQDKIQKVKDKTEKIISKGFNFDSHKFGMDPTDRIFYITVCILYFRSKIESDVIYPPDGFPLKTEDNGYYFLKKEKCNEFFNLAFNGSFVYMAQGIDEIDKINKITDMTELENYQDPRG